MKMLIRWATIAFAAAGLSIVAPLTASAQYDYNAPNSDNCSNVRTLTTDRCVHYSEKAKDGYADQQANLGDKLGVKYGTTVDDKGRLSPFGPGRDAITKDQIQNGQAQPVTIFYPSPDGNRAVQVYMTAAQMQQYLNSQDALRSLQLQRGIGGPGGLSPLTTMPGQGGTGGRHSAR
jgi:hypothetical protein